MTKKSRSTKNRKINGSVASWFLMAKSLTGPLVILFIGYVLLCGIDQTVDCMRTLVSDLSPDYWIFQAFVFWWAVQTWYASRTLLHITDFTADASETVMRLQRWLPRILGASAFFIAGYAYYNASEGFRTNLLPIFSVHGALFITYCAFVLMRRKFYRSKPLKRENYSIRWTDYRDLLKNWGFIVVSLAIFALLFAAFLIDGVFFPQLFGAPAIALSALSFWGIVFVWISDIDSRTHMPVLFLLLAAVTVFSFFNNNHGVRLLPEDTPKHDPPLLENYFSSWIEKRIAGNDGAETIPVVIIAAEGGGMRSAYWTARFLSVLEEKSGYLLGNHVFALSGVSGGSIGLSVYLSMVKSGLPDFPPVVRSVLATDLLSPVAASAFYSDFLQRFLPVPIAYFDRARPLERALEAAWEKAAPGGGRYSDSLYSPWYDPVSGAKTEKDLPAVFFNGTRIENGRRVVISNTTVGDDFTDAIDLAGEKGIGYLYRMRLSTAVFLSARFPFITPAARFYTEPDRSVWGHIGDGGYFENSGTATVYDLLTYLEKRIPEDMRERLSFHVIVLTNDAREAGEPSDFLYEATQPVSAFFNAWTARTPYSIRLLSDAADELGARFHHVNMGLGTLDVPIGWTLSERAMDRVDAYVDALFDAGAAYGQAEVADGTAADSGNLKSTGQASGGDPGRAEYVDSSRATATVLDILKAAGESRRKTFPGH